MYENQEFLKKLFQIEFAKTIAVINRQFGLKYIEIAEDIICNTFLPATNNSYEAHMFDYAIIENGKIVERIQQSDNLGQFITLFKGTFIKIGIVFLIVLVSLITALILK